MVTLAGAALSAGAGIYEGGQAAAGLEATNRAQQDANNQWVAYQQKIHNDQAQAEDAARQKATNAQQDTLSKVSPEAQAQSQTTEQGRLNSLYTQPGATTASGAGPPSASLLSGESTGNQTFMGSLTNAVNQATAAARKRIGALATASSYGGSFGGLATTVPIAFAQGGNDINLQNAIRQGNLKTYGVQQQVQPLQYEIGPGTIAQQTLSKTLGQVSGQLAGVGGPRAIGDISRAGGLSSMFGEDASGVSRGFVDPNINWSSPATVASALQPPIDWSTPATISKAISPGYSV
jgi:hypothetical protein